MTDGRTRSRLASVAVLAVLAALAMLFTGGATAGAAPAGAVTTNATIADCNAGNVCFYTGANQTGSMCKWSDADTDWASGSIRCSWALTQPARSMYNHGTSTAYNAVYFYNGTNYTSYNGCMGQGWYGNIGPTYLRSHKWVSGPC